MCPRKPFCCAGQDPLLVLVREAALGGKEATLFLMGKLKSEKLATCTSRFTKEA